MSYAILGDIHANIEALTAVLAEAGRLGADRIFCVGDVVGYNASPVECVDLLMGSEIEGVVLGNHDAAAAGESDLPCYNPMAAASMAWTRARLRPEQRRWLGALPMSIRVDDDMTLVHASLESPGLWSYVLDDESARGSLEMLDTQVCFYGHVHIPRVFRSNGPGSGAPLADIRLDPGTRYLINVGSVGQPRDRDPRAALVIFDPAAGTVALHRVEYDVDGACRRILDAGLPSRLAERLKEGR